MPRIMTRRPARAAALLALLAGTAAFFYWWTSPERRIHALLADVAAALTHETPDSGLQSVAAAARLQTHLAVDMDLEAGDVRLQGRQEVVAAAARVRAAAAATRVRFFDAEIDVGNEGTAALQVTAEVTMTNDAGEQVVDVFQVRARLARIDGRWVVTSARTVAGGEARS